LSLFTSSLTNNYIGYKHYLLSCSHDGLQITSQDNNFIIRVVQTDIFLTD